MATLSHELNTSAAADGSASTPHLPDTYAPSELYTPAELRDATMEEYIEFLQNYLAKGGKITKVYGTPFSSAEIRTVTTSGTVEDSCGNTDQDLILVPEGCEILRLKESANAETYGSTLYIKNGMCIKATYRYHMHEAVPLPRNVARAMGWNFTEENFEHLRNFEQIEFWQQEEFIAAQNGESIPEVEAERGMETLYPATLEDIAAFMIQFLQNGGEFSVSI